MIQNNSVLIDLNISVWTGRKLDKKVSDEIDASKNTKTRAGNYHKHLLAGTAKLENLQKLVGNIRNWHYTQTLPWSDGGSRLLPMKNFFDYKAQLNKFESEFEQTVNDFLREYPNLVAAAAFQLGALFDRAEYPDANELRDKFRFKYAFCPVPASGDFRVDSGEETKRELEEQYNKFYEDKLNSAMKDAWGRLHNSLTHMSTMLADLPEPRVNKKGEENFTRPFRDTLISNALEMCGLLTKLNVTDNPELEQARKQLEQVIAGVNVDDLRRSDEKRKEVKARVDEILSVFDF